MTTTTIAAALDDTNNQYAVKTYAPTDCVRVCEYKEVVKNALVESDMLTTQQDLTLDLDGKIVSGRTVIKRSDDPSPRPTKLHRMARHLSA